MALIDPCLYLQADAHPARTFRQLITAVFAEGVLGAGAMVVSERNAGDGGPNFSVDIAAGMAVVEGDADPAQGHYLCVNDDVVNVAVTSAPSAGNERYDLVVVEVQDNAEDSSGQNRPRFRVVAGPPASAGTATPPAVPNTALLLATIGPIANSTTTITDSLIVDGRTAARLAHDVIDDGSITTAKINDSAVTDAKLAANIKVRDAYAAFAFAGSFAGTLRYERLGNTVLLQGTASALSGTTIGTLPAGFRPSSTTTLVVPSGSGASDMTQVTISTGGVLQVGAFGGPTGLIFNHHFEIA